MISNRYLFQGSSDPFASLLEPEKEIKQDVIGDVLSPDFFSRSPSLDRSTPRNVSTSRSPSPYSEKINKPHSFPIMKQDPSSNLFLEFESDVICFFSEFHFLMLLLNKLKISTS